MAVTTISAHYPSAKGALALRGSLAPLSWDVSTPPTSVDGDRHVFTVDLPDGEVFEFKFVRNETDWSCGRNFGAQAGASGEVHPYFDRKIGTLDAEIRTIHSPELSRDVRYRVFLPPSYYEHDEHRYPVLYAQDGQSLFSDQPDPIDGHSWRLDDALNELYDLGAAEEMLVVAVFTDFDRLEMLSPSADPTHGGGGGPKYRDFLADTLKPHVDAAYRTEPGRKDTGLLGSSMGGLFSFFSAWTRPSIFGRAACLSSSFWWNKREMVREVAKGQCPFPRPVLYLDSGAAKSPFEEDANLRDGFHHTQALRSSLVGHCYVPGQDLHTLAFAGLSHNNMSWASRVAIPLQLLFPRRS